MYLRIGCHLHSGDVLGRNAAYEMLGEAGVSRASIPTLVVHLVMTTFLDEPVSGRYSA